eukprot:1140896-Pelagomonas_calceolata.AAC.3
MKVYLRVMCWRPGQTRRRRLCTAGYRTVSTYPISSIYTGGCTKLTGSFCGKSVAGFCGGAV